MSFFPSFPVCLCGCEKALSSYLDRYTTTTLSKDQLYLDFRQGCLDLKNVELKARSGALDGLASLPLSSAPVRIRSGRIGKFGLRFSWTGGGQIDVDLHDVILELDEISEKDVADLPDECWRSLEAQRRTAVAEDIGIAMDHSAKKQAGGTAPSATGWRARLLHNVLNRLEVHRKQRKDSLPPRGTFCRLVIVVTNRILITSRISQVSIRNVRVVLNLRSGSTVDVDLQCLQVSGVPEKTSSALVSKSLDLELAVNHNATSFVDLSLTGLVTLRQNYTTIDITVQDPTIAATTEVLTDIIAFSNRTDIWNRRRSQRIYRRPRETINQAPKQW